jgi:hypothetical protein
MLFTELKVYRSYELGYSCTIKNNTALPQLLRPISVAVFLGILISN